jgi:hypothetical protein
MRKDGLRAAARFTEDAAAASADDALRWVASGAWRHEAQASETPRQKLE